MVATNVLGDASLYLRVAAHQHADLIPPYQRASLGTCQHRTYWAANDRDKKQLDSDS